MNRLQKIFLVAILISIVSTAAMIAFVFLGPEPPDLSKVNLKELFDGEEGVALIVVPVAIIFCIITLIPVFRMIFPPKIKDGVQTSATVLKVWDTGTTLNDDPQVGLLLEIPTNEGSRFQAETKTIVSRLQVSLVQPGVTANVVYDPNNLKRVQVLDFETDNLTGNSMEDRLELITRLREKGLINEVEYQNKREEIIKSI